MNIVGLQDWMTLEHFDIDARAEGHAHIAEMAGPMLQVLLEQRFHLRVHKEPRETPVYELTLLGEGPGLHPLHEGACLPFDLDTQTAAQGDLKPSAPRQCPSFAITSWPPEKPMIADCYGMTMAEFAGLALGSFTDRPVVDKTGLSGRFEIHLEAAHTTTPPSLASVLANEIRVPDSPQEPVVSSGQSVFQAVQKQLGLKLTPARAPLDVLVIDHAERPSAN